MHLSGPPTSKGLREGIGREGEGGDERGEKVQEGKRGEGREGKGWYHGREGGVGCGARRPAGAKVSHWQKTCLDIAMRCAWTVGVDVSDTSCVTHINDIRQQMHNNDTVVYCVEWAAPVLLGVYLLIANVLLINLLIAIFR